MGLSACKVYVLGCDHLGCGADEIDVPAPECFPWGSPI